MKEGSEKSEKVRCFMESKSRLHKTTCVTLTQPPYISSSSTTTKTTKATAKKTTATKITVTATTKTTVTATTETRAMKKATATAITHTHALGVGLLGEKETREDLRSCVFVRLLLELQQRLSLVLRQPQRLKVTRVERDGQVL